MKNILKYILLLGLIGCSDSEYYKVQFDNVDRLKTGDDIIINGLVVGQVKDLIIDEQNKVLATIWIGRNIKLTKGTTFAIQSDIFGLRHLEIKLSDSKELINPKDIQKGFIQPPDTTGFRVLTPAERDSLVTHDPIYRLADTVMTILRNKEINDSIN